MSLKRKPITEYEDIYVSDKHYYMIEGNDFYILHKIPFCIGHNLKERCKVYKFDRIEDKWI